MMNEQSEGFGSPATGQTTPPSLPSVADLKDQAAQAANNARSSLNALASEARNKVNEIVDQQKATGADHLSGFARAAQSAAGDLENQSPAVARIVRDAANSVDRFAGDLRGNDVREVLNSVTSFARQQPVTFFAGSVLIGFALARFLKSDAPPGTAPRRAIDETAEGFRRWSAEHPEIRS